MKKSQQESAWKEIYIADTNISNDAEIKNGNRMFSGNGYMGIRGTCDETLKEGMVSLIANGLYDQNGKKWREPVSLPIPFHISIEVGNEETLSLQSKTLISHKQQINFHNGVFSRDTTWKIRDKKISIESKRFPSMKDKHLICQQYEILDDFLSIEKIDTEILNDVFDINGPHFKVVSSKRICMIDNFAVTEEICRTLEKGIYFVIIQAVSKKETSNSIEVTVFSSVYCGTDYEIITDKNLDRMKTDSLNSVLNAIKKGFYLAYEEHCEEWNEIWKDGDVEIKGDEEAQRNMRYSLYQLQCVAPRSGKDLSIPARGLSAQTYKGAVFWDTEIFMLPYFLYTDPNVVKSFIRYRINTLPGAIRKAESYGFKGAFYAWESQENGDDACSDYNVIDVFTKRPVRTYFKDKQIHIDAAIVYAIQEYIEVTGEHSILAEGALDVIFECALFYASRCVYIPLKDKYEFHDVIGPDEYHERVNNNSYTNIMAEFTIKTALSYLDSSSKIEKKISHDVIKKINIEKYIPLLRDVSKKIYIPKFNTDKLHEKVIPQFDSYFSLEDCNVETVRSRLLNPKEYWGGNTGVASQTQVIKQADVVLLLNMFRNEYADEECKKNYEYYLPRTEHGSSLSSCMYGLLACRINALSDAYNFFIKTSEIDITGNSKQFAGLVYIGGTHPASQGGTWIMAIQGFCGFSVSDGKIKINPSLPRNWKSVVFSAKVRGEKYKITVTKKGYTICKK